MVLKYICQCSMLYVYDQDVNLFSPPDGGSEDYWLVLPLPHPGYQSTFTSVPTS